MVDQAENMPSVLATRPAVPVDKAAEEPRYGVEPARFPLVEVVSYLAAISVVVAALIAIAAWVRDNPANTFDTRWFTTISEWDAPGVDVFLDSISVLTDNYPAMTIGFLATAYLLISGRNRGAVGLLVAGVFVGGLSLVGDGLGDYVGRSRPDDSNVSFPSGHAFGTTLFYGFAIYLGVRFKLRLRLLIPVVLVGVVLIGATGISRIHQDAHWPTDVVGGYLLGSAGLITLIYLQRWSDTIRWFAAPRLGRDIPLAAMPGVVETGSYANVVMLDADQGTAIKIYDPPFVIRILYWLAFQAKFPYDANPHALKASRYRRQIAGLLTEYRFDKNLVSPIVGMGCISGRPSIISKFIVGEEAPDDDVAQDFLTKVTVLFAAAGMPVWQLNPRNPHSHTNLIRTAEGDNFIVDLESAIVTPFPAKGQIRSMLRRGSFPVFDDIDFLRLRAFIQVHEAELRLKLGEGRFVELRTAVMDGEAAFNSWQGSELRIASKLIRFTYSVLNWKQLFVRSRHAVTNADVKAEEFLTKGLDRWIEEGRITAEEAEALKTELRSHEIHEVMRHLGAHVAISAALRFPFGSIARPLWTLGFWVKDLYRYARTGSTACLRFIKVHSPAVLLLSVIPGFGAFAYMASKPLRRLILIRLMFDSVGRKVPFKLNSRLGVERLVAQRKARPEKALLLDSVGEDD